MPEHQVLDAQQIVGIVFRAAAAPDVEHTLTNHRLAPASTVVDGKNVFLCDADAGDTMAAMPPGMEGFAVLDVGSRPAWWLLSHRFLGWLRLNFWV